MVLTTLDKIRFHQWENGCCLRLRSERAADYKCIAELTTIMMVSFCFTTRDKCGSHFPFPFSPPEQKDIFLLPMLINRLEEPLLKEDLSDRKSLGKKRSWSQMTATARKVHPIITTPSFPSRLPRDDDVDEFRICVFKYGFACAASIYIPKKSFENG